MVAGATLLGLSSSGFAVVVSGNIGSNSIEIDNSANLYPGGATVTCATPPNFGGSVKDWVKDCLPNTDTATTPDPVAVGVIPGVSGAAATGHWYGARIVDGIAGNDQNIFLTGGKEQKPLEWNIGPGSVGSAKYDITQAYIANNSNDVFLGMERRGNNGTTAFDFEFNRLSPTTNPLGMEVPNRSNGDVLLTFEMQGSGGSGSATPFYYRYDATVPGYVPVTDSTTLAKIVSKINQAAVPSAPWGTVNDKGNWVVDNIDRFQFAEAKVDLDLLDPSGSFDPCTGASRFVQVRTRSSSVENSDLKDTTRVFEYQFFQPQSPATNLATNCSQQFTFGSTPSASGWTFTAPSNVTLAGVGGVTLAAGSSAGVYTTSSPSGTVAVTLPTGAASATIQAVPTATDANGCSANGAGTITVYRSMSAGVVLSQGCASTLDYAVTWSGGKAPYSLALNVERETAPGVWTAVGSTQTFANLSTTSRSGTLSAADLGNQQGNFRVSGTVTDSQTPACTATFSATRQVRDPLAATATKTSVDPSTLAATLTANVTAGTLAGDVVGYQWQKSVNGGGYTNIAGATSSTYSYPLAAFDTDGATTAGTTFTLSTGAAAGSYVGKLQAVSFKVVVSRNLNGAACPTQASNAPSVKKIVAVDP